MDFCRRIIYLTFLVAITFSSSCQGQQQQWITHFNQIEPQSFRFISSSSRLFPASPLIPADEARGKMQFIPVTTTTTVPTTIKSQSNVNQRRRPLKSTLVGGGQRKSLYHARNASVNKKKIYEYGNQHQTSQIHRKKVNYFTKPSNNNQGGYTRYVHDGRVTNIQHPSFVPYPFVYTRNKQSSTTNKNGEIEIEESRVSSNPPEQIAPTESKIISVTAPKFIGRRPNGRSASLMDSESSHALNPDRSLGNDMLYYPEPSSHDDAESSFPDKNGISNDPNSEFVIIK